MNLYFVFLYALYMGSFKIERISKTSHHTICKTVSTGKDKAYLVRNHTMVNPSDIARIATLSVVNKVCWKYGWFSTDYWHSNGCDI